MFEIEYNNGKHFYPVMQMLKQSGTLTKTFRPNVKLIGMGSHGPQADNLEGWINRARIVKINVSFHCCTHRIILTDLSEPNKKWYAKMVNGKEY